MQDIDGTPYDFRQAHAIGATVLDHALTGLSRASDGRVWAHLRSAGRQVSLWAGAGYGWLQVFSSDTLHGERHRKAVAIEPMTCPPDALVTGHDLIVLAPGESVSTYLGRRGPRRLSYGADRQGARRRQGAAPSGNGDLG